MIKEAKEWANKNSCCLDGGKCCANVTEAFQAGFEHGLAEGRKENELLEDMKEVAESTDNESVKLVLTYLIKKWG